MYLKISVISVVKFDILVRADQPDSHEEDPTVEFKENLFKDFRYAVWRCAVELRG